MARPRRSWEPPFLATRSTRQDIRSINARISYSLGALGYWLLSGRARLSCQDLCRAAASLAARDASPEQHAQAAQAASTGSAPTAEEEIPQELDALIQSLLRLDPAERPEDTATVIERVNAVAGLEPEARDEAVQGYLDSKAFVGRERERERFARS